MMQTLVGYWAYTLSIGNLLVAMLSVLFFLAAALMFGARRSARWAQMVTTPVVLVGWWWIACQGGLSMYRFTHKGESFLTGLGAMVLTFIPGFVLILGTTVITYSLRERRTHKQ